MLPIQIFLLIFFSFAAVKVFGRYRKGDIEFKEAVSWILFWVLAGIVIINPDITSYFAKIFGVNRGSDMVVYIAVAGLFFLVFRLMVKIDQLDKNITKIVRDRALDEKK